jgi:hypothetical protein
MRPAELIDADTKDCNFLPLRRMATDNSNRTAIDGQRVGEQLDDRRVRGAVFGRLADGDLQARRRARLPRDRGMRRARPSP